MVLTKKQKEYRLKNRDKILQYQKEYYMKNREKIRERKKKKYNERTEEQKQAWRDYLRNYYHTKKKKDITETIIQ